MYMTSFPVTLSLTTYSTRIETVHKTIESLKKQTLSADLILLWLDESEFTLDTIPKVLFNLQDDQFNIKFCANFKSYKKLIPSLELIEKGVIITFDDDIIYSDNIVQDLVEQYERNQQSVICSRARIISKDNEGAITPYSHWHFVRNSEALIAEHCLLPLGYGGVLYPVEKLLSDIRNVDTFMSLSPTADDIWFKCISLLSGLSTVVLPSTSSDHFVIIDGSQENALYLTHNTENQNGNQLNAVINHFSALKSKFNSEHYAVIGLSSGYFEKLCKKAEYDVRDMASVETFREGAIGLENVDINMANSLMKIALKLRPHGSFIKQKIAQYKKLIGK